MVPLVACAGQGSSAATPTPPSIANDRPGPHATPTARPAPRDPNATPLPVDSYTTVDAAGPLAIPAGEQLTITLGSGTIGARAFCNWMGATYRIVDGRLVADDVSRTIVSCTPEGDSLDDRIETLLESHPYILVSNDQLVFNPGPDEVVLRRQTDETGS
jgi:heat shock protein HslJ